MGWAKSPRNDDPAPDNQVISSRKRSPANWGSVLPLALSFLERFRQRHLLREADLSVNAAADSLKDARTDPATASLSPGRPPETFHLLGYL